MFQTVPALQSLIVGSLLGVLYFGGLWWTVRRTLQQELHVARYLLSFFLRSALVLVGFYYLALTYGLHVLFGMLGFLLSRLLITRHLRPQFSQGEEEQPR